MSSCGVVWQHAARLGWSCGRVGSLASGWTSSQRTKIMRSASVFSSEFKPDQPRHGTAAVRRLRAVSPFSSTMKKSLLTIVWLACVLASAQAGVILSDTFSYPDGPLVGAAGSPWKTFIGTTGQVDVISGRAHLTAAETEGVNAPLTGAPYAFGALYASFTLNLKTLPSAGGNFFAAFNTNGSSNFRARVFVLTGGAALGKYRVGIANAAASAVAVIATDLTPGVDYQLVVRYNNSAVAATTSTLWLNPCSESQTVNCVTASDTPPSASITTFALRQATGIGDLQMDNLLAGTVFSDVGGDSIPPAIHCPTNLAVLTCAENGERVFFNVTATDDRDPNVVPVCVPASGSVFPLGATTVICSAADACGNVSRCLFVVSVLRDTNRCVTVASRSGGDTHPAYGGVDVTAAALAELIRNDEPVPFGGHDPDLAGASLGPRAASSSPSSPREERVGRGPRRGEINKNAPPLPSPLLHPMEEREESR